MNKREELHSKFTFQDALSDYAELSGFSLSERMKKSLTSQFYKPNLEIESVSAVQYGNNIWLLGFEEDLKWLEGVFAVNTKTSKVVRLV